MVLHIFSQGLSQVAYRFPEFLQHVNVSLSGCGTQEGREDGIPQQPRFLNETYINVYFKEHLVVEIYLFTYRTHVLVYVTYWYKTMNIIFVSNILSVKIARLSYG